MSIFLIILLAFLIGVLVGLIGLLIISVCTDMDSPTVVHVIICVFISAIVWIGGIFVGIGILTEEERAYVAQYEAQKYTIEASLVSDSLSGLERVELVNQAAIFNGEMAKRKVTFNRWDYVTYDPHMYDNVELIDITGGKK
jgi:Ethanolamine utilization protein EutJ (predicted chaperonin)